MIDQRAVAGAAAKKVNSDGLERFLRQLVQKHAASDELAILCIGSDRSTGDALGPLVGAKLQELGWPNIFGTLRQPCDAVQLEGIVKSIPEGKVILAIDACLGKPGSVGHYLVAEGPLQPGQSVGANLAPLGNYSIAAVVNTMGPKPYASLQSASLYLVMQMAQQLAMLLHEAWTAAGFTPIIRNG